MSDIVLIGGGGHCGVVIDVIEQHGKYRIAGIVDVKEKVGSKVRGYKVFATDDDLEKLTTKYENFCLTIGHTGSDKIRRNLHQKLKALGATFPVIISKHAIVAADVAIGEGTVIMHGVVINVGTTIGVCGIINTSSVVEHDCMLGDHCHVAPGAVLTGGCVVNLGSFIGAGAVLIPGITVGSNSIVGAGSTVISNVPDNSVVAGSPAKLKKKI